MRPVGFSPRRLLSSVCHVLVILAPALCCWQWIVQHWPLIWLAVWRGCVEVVERPTSAWQSCGSSSSPPAPTCAGSDPSIRPSSEHSELTQHFVPAAVLLNHIVPDVYYSPHAGPTALSTLWLSSSSSWPRWWSVLSKLLAFQAGEYGKSPEQMIIKHRYLICLMWSVNTDGWQSKEEK